MTVTDSLTELLTGPYPEPSQPSVTGTDAHRLMLHVALTATGVPPAPEDLHTIRQLAGLDAVAVGAVVRWLEYAAHSPSYEEDTYPDGMDGMEGMEGDEETGPGVGGSVSVGVGVGFGTGTGVGMGMGVSVGVEVGRGGELPPPNPTSLVDPRLLTW